ncbi:rhodanese-like domain-containing protein [Paracoccus sp. DMF-8]|uniref:rhodanese-like domain-containing protein n=1 Tax=Paracoccus sp. DMF-8 TaxID=3019445 RepID=UPI003204CCC1
MIRIAAAICLSLTGSAALSQPPEPPGFRGPPYQAETPATLSGAQVIGAAQAVALHDAGVLFVDVYPRQKRPEGLPEGTIWRAAPHQTIPGAIWLYDTGYDRLSDAESRRLAAGLARELRSRESPVVIFCRADCWMGWNAAKRAVALGYRNVMWFPGGTDDWLLQGRDLQDITADAP